MRVQVTQVVPGEMLEGRPWISGPGDNIYDADHWTVSQMGDLELFDEINHQVATLRHWTKIEAVVE